MKIAKSIVPPLFIETINTVFPGLDKFLKLRKIKRRLRKKNHLELVEKSVALKNKHINDRIFIVGTGPSIKNQDLLKLKDEVVIGLNEFYLHPQIEQIKQKYFMYTGYSVHTETVSYDTAVESYVLYEKIMKAAGGIVLLPAWDIDFLNKNGLMNDDEMEKYYFNYALLPEHLNQFQFDSPYASYGGQNSAIFSICLAMFMGAKEIYLLGLDHDWILSYYDREQAHFYDDDKSPLYRDQKATFKRTLLKDYFYPYVKMFEQYEALENYAKKHDIKIINLTHKGLLDVFERQDYEGFFAKDKEGLLRGK